jgi:hypothetical protein
MESSRKQKGLIRFYVALLLIILTGVAPLTSLAAVTCEGIFRDAKATFDANDYVLPNPLPPTDQGCYGTCALHAHSRALTYNLRNKILPGFEASTTWYEAASVIINAEKAINSLNLEGWNNITAGGSEGGKVVLPSVIENTFGVIPKGDFKNFDLATFVDEVRTLVREHMEKLFLSVTEDGNDSVKLVQIAKESRVKLKELAVKRGLDPNRKIVVNGSTTTPLRLSSYIDSRMGWLFIKLDPEVPTDAQNYKEAVEKKDLILLTVPDVDSLAKVLLDALKRGKIPAAIIRNFRVTKTGQLAVSDSGAHGVVLIGIQKNPKYGHREFVFQNSWGNNINSNGLIYANDHVLSQVLVGLDIPFLKN